MSEYKSKYNPDRHANWNYGGKDWKLSRSKIELFIECPRCFYLDNKLGTKRPPFPSFTLNNAVDELLKKEFDEHRKNKTAHPLVTSYGFDFVPFQHNDIDVWRDNFSGIQYKHPETGLVVSGAVDDVWINNKHELIVVDYKATVKDGDISSLSDSSWHESYQRQMGIYQWLLKKNGFSVSDTGYFLFANCDTKQKDFSNQLKFDTTLVPCDGSTEWVDDILVKIKDCLESDVYPEANPYCEFCRYRESCGKKLQKIYAKSRK